MADDRFKSSIDGLSRALSERRAAHPDPVGEAMERRAAVQAELERQERRGWMILGSGAALLAIIGIVAGILYMAHPFASVPASAPVAVAEAAPPPPDTPVVVSPPASAPEPPPAPAPVMAADLAPVTPDPLDQAEVREVQSRLLRFGFDPGPVDGDAGRLTQAAAARYQQKRGVPGTGAADRALLEQLRQDPAPQADPPRQVASRRGTWRDSAASSGQPARRSSGFLDSLRSADNSLSRWLNSLGR
jgi:hypothetical protein